MADPSPPQSPLAPEPDFRALFEAAPGLYLVLTPDLLIAAVSDAYLRATMTRREAILGRPLFDVFPDNSDDPAATGVKNLRASLERVLAHRAPDAMPLQNYDPPAARAPGRPAEEGGEYEERYWSPVNSPVLDDRGQLRYIIHRVEDVTDFVRLKAEGVEHDRLTQELRARAEQMEADLFSRAHQIEEANRKLIGEERFRAIYEHAAVGLEQVGLDGRLLLVNRALCEMLGCAPEELQATTFEAITHPDDRPREAGLLSELLAGKRGGYRLEKRYLRRDGSPVWVDLTTSLVHDREGKPIHRISVVVDMSERRRAAAELTESEERFRALYEHAAVGIKQVGLDGRLLLVNRAFGAMLGCAPEELQGKYLQEITHPDDRPRDAALFQELLEGKRSDYRLEKRHVRRDGTPIWVDLSTSLVHDREGRPLYRIAAVIDISERRRAEAALRELNESLEERVRERTQQLTEINAEMEAFSYTVSHDLRAPLRSMQGFAQALEEDYANRLDAEGRDYLQRVTGSARRMERLIEDLLAYSRLSREQLRRDAVPLDGVLQDALAQLAADIEARNAAVDVTRPLPPVLAHRTTLTQVVVNLLSNALKFTRPDERPRVRVRAEKKEGKVCLWVEDEGIGIKPEHCQRIFRVFERLHGMEHYPGTGIGLAIVRKAVERMGGAVGVESELGRGSRFRIELEAVRDAR
jgi:PAS domain S-box-containing protein